MTTQTNPIFAKIKKLLALADSARNSSEAEAQAAALKVQELLQDHGLTLAQLESEGGTSDEGGREAAITDRRALYLWQQNLMAALANNNFCMHQLRVVEAMDGGKKRRSKRHLLVGRQLNINVSVATYDYLSGAVRRAATEAGFDHANNERDHHVFLDGAVSRLIERLNDRRIEREAEEAKRKAEAMKAGTGGNALVLSDVYGSETDLNNDVLNGFPAGTTAARRNERQAKEAARAAHEAELIKSGVGKTEAFYRSHGYSEVQAAEYASSWDKKQAAEYASSWDKKQARRSRASRGSWTRSSWTRADENHAQKIASPAYKAGRAAGSTIGIDTQVSTKSQKVIK